MPNNDYRTVDEMEQDILAKMQERQDKVAGTMPVRLRTELIKVERLRLAEEMKIQLARALSSTIQLPFKTTAKRTEEYRAERAAKCEEWGDRPILYMEPLVGEDGVIERYLYADDRHYAKHMGFYLAQEPPWPTGEFVDGDVDTAESLLLAGVALAMSDGECAFTLDALRATMTQQQCDFRLAELSDYKLSQLLQGLACVKIQVRTSTEGQRHRYLGAWQTTTPKQFEKSGCI